MTEKAAFPAQWINDLVAKHPLPWYAGFTHPTRRDTLDVYDANGVYIGRRTWAEFGDIIEANIVVTKAKIAAEERNGKE